MTRLGLWNNYQDFVNTIKAGGLGIQELLTLDMRQKGVYISRQLSFRGTDFEILSINIDDEMIHMYNESVKMWKRIKNELEDTVSYQKQSDLQKMRKFYWNCNQRFYIIMCISSKIKKVVEIANEEIKKGNCIVIGIQSTGESNTKSALNNQNILNEETLDGFICGPKEIYKRFIESFYKLPTKPEDYKIELIEELNSMIENGIKKVSGNNLIKIEDYIKDIKCEECNKDIENEEKYLICSHCFKHVIHKNCINNNGEDDQLQQWFCLFCKHCQETDKNYKNTYLNHIEFYNKIKSSKDLLLSDVEKMTLPQNPLDVLIDEMGGIDKVAEMTGRTSRLIKVKVSNNEEEEEEDSPSVKEEKEEVKMEVVKEEKKVKMEEEEEVKEKEESSIPLPLKQEEKMEIEDKEESVKMEEEKIENYNKVEMEIDNNNNQEDDEDNTEKDESNINITDLEIIQNKVIENNTSLLSTIQEEEEVVEEKQKEEEKKDNSPIESSKDSSNDDDIDLDTETDSDDDKLLVINTTSNKSKTNKPHISFAPEPVEEETEDEYTEDDDVEEEDYDDIEIDNSDDSGEEIVEKKTKRRRVNNSTKKNKKVSSSKIKSNKPKTKKIKLFKSTKKVEYEYRYVNRSKDDNILEKNAFMNGDKLIAIISDATSTGISLQSDKKCKNIRKRIHITLELPWSATKAIQQLGRTHRSNQAVPPSYILLLSNIGGEIRFAYTISNRLQQLGALTMGNRYATSGAVQLGNLSIDNKNGNKAIKLIGNIIMKKEKAPVNARILDDLTKGIDDKRIRRMNDNDFELYIRKIRDWFTDMEMSDFTQENNLLKRYFNRLLCEDFDIQSQLLCYFYDILHYINEKENLNSPIDNGIILISGGENNIKEINKEVIDIHNTGNYTTHYTYEIETGMKFDQINEINNKKKNSSKDGFYSVKDTTNPIEYIYIQQYEDTDPEAIKLKMKYNIHTLNLYKYYTPIYGKVNKPLSDDDFQYFIKVEDNDIELVCKYWEDEYTRSLNECIHHGKCKYRNSCQLGKRKQRYDILSGSFLFIWGTIFNKLQDINYYDKKVRIVRIKPNDSETGVIGIKLPLAIVSDVLNSLKSVPKAAIAIVDDDEDEEEENDKKKEKENKEIPKKRQNTILQASLVKRKVLRRGLKPLHKNTE